ncbi:MAG: hemerythrin domain-containing protein [Myxococcales bacterium]|nr:hemerythrin domain-containing protein [Myxococcales bacterium]
MNPRFSLYHEIHKGLRRQLLQQVLECGQVDPRDRSAVASLTASFRSLRSLLEEHAQHEQRWVEPRLERIRADIASSLAAEHETLDRDMLEVERALERWASAEDDRQVALGLRAHAALASFAGAYLSHMAREEDEAMPALQAVFSDEELMAVSVELRGSVAPERMAEFMSVMIPALNVEERSQLFAGLKAGAPPEVLQGMCALAADVLDPDAWSQVQSRVGL